VDKPLKSVTHGQCDAGPTVTFPAAEQQVADVEVDGSRYFDVLAGVHRRRRPTFCSNSSREITPTGTKGGSVAEWLACWTQAQKGPGSNRSRDRSGPCNSFYCLGHFKNVYDDDDDDDDDDVG